MTYEEYKTQFSLWCMWTTPIMISSDLRTMDKKTIEIFSNEDIIKYVS